MKTTRLIALILCAAQLCSAQRAKQKETVLDHGPLPDLRAISDQGEPINLRELCKGKYTVLSAGCLTCPQFHEGYTQVEAMSADYADKGVQFFFIYKSLRHPELSGYVQAQNISERLLQLDAARKKLGTTIPWIADTFDDSIRIGLKAGANSIYLISPDGTILDAASRLEGNTIRDTLAKHVGPIKHPTAVSDLNLPRVQRQANAINVASDLTVERPADLTIVTTIPDTPDETYYVKLRAEADPDLLRTGTGRLFIGFYPDPIHDAHWNNLAAPMRYELTLPDGLTATPVTATAAQGPGDSDTQPRQFWVDITGPQNPGDLQLALHYFGCAPGLCMALTHTYTVRLEPEDRGSATFGFNRARQRNGSSNKGQKSGQKTRGNQASQRGGSGHSRFAKLDANKDGSVTFAEMVAMEKQRRPNDFDQARSQRRFDQMDTNNDNVLSQAELDGAQQPGGRR